MAHFLPPFGLFFLIRFTLVSGFFSDYESNTRFHTSRNVSEISKKFCIRKVDLKQRPTGCIYVYVWLTLTAGSGSRPTLSWWSAASRSSRASASSRAGRRSEIYSHDITAESVVDEDSTWVLIVLSESCNYKTLIWAATWPKCFLFFLK